MGLSGVKNSVLIVSTLFCAASTSVVGLRIYDRRRNRKLPLAMDDYACLVSLASSSSWVITTILWVTCFHLGSKETLTGSALREYRITSYVARILYVLTFDVAKIAIILFYIKLTNKVTQRTYWLVLTVVLAFMYLDTMLHLLVIMIPCSPVSDYWNVGTTSPRCWSSTESAMVVNVFTFISEGLIVLAPIPLLWLAGLDNRQRVALGCMFSLASLIIVASGLKLRNVLVSQTQYPSYDLGVAWIWVAVESQTALLVAGFLPLKALLSSRFYAMKRRFSSPNTEAEADGTNRTRNGSLAPSDPYDLDLIASLKAYPNSPQSATLTMHDETFAPGRDDVGSKQTFGEA